MLKIDLAEFITSLSEALDLMYVGIEVDWGGMSHSAKVCHISCKIAEQMKLDKSTTIDLYYAALLHDIGLFLNRQLMEIMHFETHEEFSHCKRGYEILKKCSYTSKLANIVLHHHDKWDGLDQTNLASREMTYRSPAASFIQPTA